MSFGSKVQELRKAKKVSQEDFGVVIGLSPKHISKIENNKLIPYAQAIKSIAKYLNVSTDYLLFDDVPRNADLKSFNDVELVDLVFKAENISDEARQTAKNVLKALITESNVEKFLK